MSFKQIHNDGAVARKMGRSRRENPYYESENLPASESAAAYRAWQMKAEAWECGWLEQDQLLTPAPKRAQQPQLTADRRAIPLTARVQNAVRTQVRGHEGAPKNSAGGMAA